MSTRCTLHFRDKYGDSAIVYRHSDGYPEGDSGVIADFNSFLDAVEEQTSDRRFNDPSYLAAKFVVWQANQYARTYNYEKQEYEPVPMLNFLSVGVVLQDPGDLAYRYFVNCDGEGKDGRPTLTIEKRIWPEGWREVEV